MIECYNCGWEGEPIELIDAGECPECYALLIEE